ncbi:MAG TPA: GNAT family N-acetyltransferase, partial [Usitatibacter sp.]
MSGRGPVAVDPLDRHPRLAPRLCEEFTREWPAWCGSVTRARLEACFASAPDGGLPIVFVAHDHGVPLGTVSLRPWFAEEPMTESPWVRGLLVFPEFRGGAVLRALESAVEAYARDSGFAHLHAGVTSMEPMLLRRGWKAFRRVSHEGKDMAWMRNLVSETNFPGA